MTTSTTEAGLPTPLIRYLRVQAQFDAELKVLLERAYAEANKHLRLLESDERIGRQVRAAQIRNAQAAINRELSQLYAKTGDLVRARRAQAAAEAAEAVFAPVTGLLAGAGIPERAIGTMLRSERASAIRGVENAVSRVTLTARPLSERVYAARVLTSGQLDNIITSAIARGASAAELAKAVRPFIDPNTPGGVKYASERLGRTELNNAFHGTQITKGIESPFVTAMRWQLSGSHPRPDECNEYAAGGDLKDGLWSPEAVPGKPHPNCLCWLEAETPSREEFLRKYQAGEYNTYLEEQGVTEGLPSAA